MLVGREERQQVYIELDWDNESTIAQLGVKMEGIFGIGRITKKLW